MKTKNTNNKTEIYNLIILDQSGSMSTICDEAIGSCNESIGTIRVSQSEHTDTQIHYLSILKFCHCNTQYIFENIPIDQAHTINDKDYNPCCTTPLFDAMGTSLNKLYNQIKDKPDATAAVTIITDGYENASVEYDVNAIKALINKLKAEGWLFAYIGADHDVESVAMSINIENTLRFEKSHEGTQRMSRIMSTSRANYYDNLDNLYFETREMSPTERKNSYSKMNNERNFFTENGDERS